jgi:hypothetical protein
VLAAAHLGVARVVRRLGPAGLVAISVAAAIAVVVVLLGVAVDASDVALQRALADRPVAERTVTLRRNTDIQLRQGEADARSRGMLDRIRSLTRPVVTVTTFPPGAYGLVVAVDDAQRWARLTAGRMAKPCTGGSRCEGMLISEPFQASADAGRTTQIGDLTIEIVGSADIGPDFPLGLSSLGQVVLVDGTAMVTDPATAASSRSTTWIAELDPSRVHSWDLPALRATIDGIGRDIALADAAMAVDSPERTFDAVEARAAVASGRIVFIGSLIVAVLFAFAVFAAAIDRDDVRSEHRRLVAAGGRRRHLLALVGTEAVGPALVGTILGWLLGLAVVAALAVRSGTSAGDLLRGSILTPLGLGVGLAAGLVATLAVGLGLLPAAGRFVRPRLLALAVLPVVLVLAWDRVTRGSTTPRELAIGAAGPGTVLLPGLLGLAVILASLAVLPPLFRRAAVVSSRLPLSLRLAILSIARQPLRPAATLTLLGFSFGCAVFGLGYGGTLRQGAADAAAFQAGMDVRITSAVSQVPFTDAVLEPIAHGALGRGVEMHPVLRNQAEVVTLGQATILGMEPSAIPALRGWRSDFSPSTPEQLRDAIAMPGDWRLPGHPLPSGVRELAIRVTATLDGPQDTDGTDADADARAPTVDAEIDTGHGTFRTVRLGPLRPGDQSYRVPIFQDAELGGLGADAPSGWRLVGLTVSLPGLDSGFPSVPQLHGTIAVAGLPELASPGHPIDLDLSFDHPRQVIRGKAATDGLVLPAIVSPELANTAGPEGLLTIELPTSTAVTIRAAAVATWFPTITDASPSMVIVDAAPLLLALNADAPGSAAPNEALVRTPDDATTAAVVAALRRAPFPRLDLQSRPGLEAAAATDPLGVGISTTLLVGALAGLALALAGMILAGLAELRDERGELADLEEQGLGPSILRRLVVVRSTLVLVLALAAGSILGLGLTWFGSVTLAVGPTDASPIPPLAIVVPWQATAGLGVGLAIAVGAASFLMATRRFGGRRLLHEAEA